MPLWSRIAIVTLLLVAAAIGVASTLQAVVARRAMLAQARTGAEGVAGVLAKAAAFAEEAPVAFEAEIGEQMLTQARLVAQLVAMAEEAGIPHADVLTRLRQVADQGGAEFLATDGDGVTIYETNPTGSGFRFSADPAAQPRAHVFHRLIDGEIPSVVQESRKREIDDLIFKYAGVPGVDSPRIVQVGMEARFLARIDRALGLRRLVGELVGGDVREVRIVDARSSPLLTRVIDAAGSTSDAPLPLNQGDLTLVRDSIGSGRPVGRSEGDTYRVAAPVQRADGLPAGAVLVAIASRTGTDLGWLQGLAALASAIAVGIPALLASLWMAEAIARPVRTSIAAAESIATGDLRGAILPGGDDETGRLLDSVGKMSESLRDLVGRIRAAGERLTTVETDVSTSLSRQERIVRGFSGSTADIAGAVSQISANSDLLLATTGTVTAAAREAARVTDEGREGLESMSESMRQLDDAMNAFTRKLATIRQRASGITSVVTTIAKVADQTNLLSVNATIEAEKAGEAGRGFRIVAQEIRRLADQTALATKDIERMVRDMQSAVSSGTMEMDRFRNEVSARIQQVAVVSDQLARIVVPVQSVTKSLDHVHDGMETQSAGARQIRDAMERLRAGVGQTSSATDGFSVAMDEMRRAIADLNEEVAHFRTDPARSASEPHRQAAGER